MLDRIWVQIAICYLIRCDTQCVDLYLRQWGHVSERKDGGLEAKIFILHMKIMRIIGKKRCCGIM